MSSTSAFQNPKSGSIKVSGTVDIVDEHGNVLDTRTDPKFSGCGLSQDKPFCDKSHVRYVEHVISALNRAREKREPIVALGVIKNKAKDVRERWIEHQIASGDALVGVKYGASYLRESAPEKVTTPIFGYLTASMEVKGALDLQTTINSCAESEVVFKLSKDLDREISREEVLDFVSHLAPGIEIYDCGYSDEVVYSEDAIADNGFAGNFAVGEWVPAAGIDFAGTTLSIFENGVEVESAPSSNIQGDVFTAVVTVSKLLAEVGRILPTGSLIFSGSATGRLKMKSNSTYEVKVENLGTVSVETIN